MVLENRKVNKQNISNSFRGILRISPDSTNQDIGFINENEVVVSDSVGCPSAISLGTKSVSVKNLFRVSGETTLSGNTTITGDSVNINTNNVSISTDNNEIDLCGVNVDLNEPKDGDILYYQDNKLSLENLESFILETIKKYNITMIGHIMVWPSNTIPPGWLLCDGRLLNQSDYPDLFNILGHTFTNTEQDNINIQFRIPDFRGIFLRGNKEGRRLGSYEASGVPNITGSFPCAQNRVLLNENYGAFYHSGYQRQGWGNGISYESYVHIVNIDAKRNSQVYKDGITEAYPNNISVNFIIKY